MNELAKIFEYEGVQVRTVVRDEQVWFVAKDVCIILDISDARQAVERLDEDERCLIPVMDSMGRNQDTFVVNEFGLYSLILGSRKPEAKQFKRFVTHDVLPTLRKTGKYELQQAQPPQLTQPDWAKIVGEIEARKRSARSGRNPQTGATIEIPESVAPAFKAGNKLKEATKNVQLA